MGWSGLRWSCLTIACLSECYVAAAMHDGLAARSRSYIPSDACKVFRLATSAICPGPLACMKRIAHAPLQKNSVHSCTPAFRSSDGAIRARCAESFASCVTSSHWRHGRWLSRPPLIAAAGGRASRSSVHQVVRLASAARAARSPYDSTTYTLKWQILAGYTWVAQHAGRWLSTAASDRCKAVIIASQALAQVALLLPRVPPDPECDRWHANYAPDLLHTPWFVPGFKGAGNECIRKPVQLHLEADERPGIHWNHTRGLQIAPLQALAQLHCFRMPQVPPITVR
jgi:hypothetical protein